MPETAFDLDRLIALLGRLGLAVLLALPIGWEREISGRSAGLRTFPLVALAACGFVVTALQVLGTDSEAQARVLEGLITGVGFIGGGAILKERRLVRGTATAASIWATGALGAAVGYGRLDTAVLLSVLTLAVLWGLSAIERHISRKPSETLSDEADGDDA